MGNVVLFSCFVLFLFVFLFFVCLFFYDLTRVTELRGERLSTAPPVDAIILFVIRGEQEHQCFDSCGRFPKTKGVAGYVATTGETLNITDAYHDDRFNRYERGLNKHCRVEVVRALHDFMPHIINSFMIFFFRLSTFILQHLTVVLTMF